MWIKYLSITLLFYFFAILQNSFLAHFSIFGEAPNLILILYFLLIFFEEPDKYHMGIFGAFMGGFFLDIFSHSYFGGSILYLLILMFLVKRALQLLWKKSGEFSIFYFLPLFAVYSIFYNILFNAGLVLLSRSFLNFNVNWTLAIALVYNLLFAAPSFFICKKFNLLGNIDRQLKLF